MKLFLHRVACFLMSGFFLAATVLMGTFLFLLLQDVGEIGTLAELSIFVVNVVFFMMLTGVSFFMVILPWTEPLPETTNPA